MFVFIAFQAILLSLIQLNDALNVSNLLDMYSAVCGNELCDRSLVNYSLDVANDSSCPKCTCDISCIHDGTCCPDIFLQLQPKCIKSTLLEENPSITEKTRVLMLNTCPVGSNETIKNLCEAINYDNEELLKNVPVTSEKSGLTYRNVYCSQCFNESLEYIRSWTWEMKCRRKADFNFLSSYNELFDLAKERQCSIYYRNASEMKISSCDLHDVINSCNISGTWHEYDSDVEYACQTYDNRFEFFKNVFCYICNPPHPNKQVIKHCNISGLWTPYDSDLQKACSDTRQMTIMGSYKNLYCYLCNRNNTKLTNDSIFSDNTVKLISQSSRNRQRQFILEYYIIDVDIPQIIKRSQAAVLSTKKTTSAINYLTEIVNAKELDVFNLLKHYYAYTGFADFCHNYSFFHTLRSCSCNDSCYFEPSGCCIDKMLENTTKAIKCTDEVYSTSRFSYAVYSICDTKQDGVLNRLCQENNNDDLFTYLPVQATTNSGYVIQYKNIFCVLCNAPLEFQALHGYRYNLSVLFWTLRIVCDVYVPIKYHVLFKDYINYVKHNNCQFYYEPIGSKSVRKCDAAKFDRCNITGELKSYENDISGACDYVTNLNSVFCSICNPVNATEIMYTTCNETGLWEYNNTDISANCLNLPRIEGVAPYKNYFCRLCNTQSQELSNDAEMLMRTFPQGVGLRTGRHRNIPVFPPPIPSFRIIFAFSNYDKEPQVELVNMKCNESQRFLENTNDCRKIKCYPGRILTNKGCIPLLEIATNLGYIISFGMKGTLVKTIDNTLAFVQSMESAFKTFLQNLLQTFYLTESTYLMSNLPCTASSKWKNNSHVLVSFFQTIFIDQAVNRSAVEDRLVSLPNTKLNVSYKDIVQSFVLSKDDSAFYLPNLESKLKLAGKCFLKNTYVVENAEFFRHSHVNKLLMCEQTELSESEFSVTVNNLKLSLNFVAKELSYDDYILVSSNKARLCLNTILNLEKGSDDENTLNVLEILQIGCSCISLVCLLSTFVTYCFFSTMRTMPGKNNMCLIFSMFWSNFIFQFIILGKKSEIGCKVLGVMIHYFWLATFACLSVCSYHMYMVFTSKTGAHFSEKRQLRTYIIYSFVFPALIITANSVITASIDNSSIGYGGHVCFLNEMIAFIVTFILPITLICCSNLFFVLTSVTIARTPKVKTEDRNQVNQIHFTVYVKLFTITGISWIFQIIDSFLPMSAFSIIVSIMNTLQGVFIFASYILNKRVFMLYKNVGKSVYEYSSSRSTSSSKRTMTTELND